MVLEVVVVDEDVDVVADDEVVVVSAAIGSSTVVLVGEAVELTPDAVKAPTPSMAPTIKMMRNLTDPDIPRKRNQG
jgi:hypothetical protein